MPWFSCIGLLDRFLQQSINSSTAGAGYVTQKNLQLIAVAAFLIAAKVEVSGDGQGQPTVIERSYLMLGNTPSTGWWACLCDGSYLHKWASETNGKEDSSWTSLRTQPTDEVRSSTLSEYDPQQHHRVFSLQFLRRYSFVSSAGDEQHAIGKFLIDMALLDVACIGLAPSLIAASATYIARHILNSNQPSTFEHCWPQELQQRSPYKTMESLAQGVKTLAQYIDKYLNGTSPKECEILIKRYEHDQLSQASLYCVQQRALIHRLASEWHIELHLPCSIDVVLSKGWSMFVI